MKKQKFSNLFIYTATFVVAYILLLMCGVVDGFTEVLKYLFIYIIGIFIPIVANKITAYFF